MGRVPETGVLRQLFEEDLLELHLHGWAGAELQGENSRGIEPHGVVVDEFGRNLTVDLEGDEMAARHDVILIPLTDWFQGNRFEGPRAGPFPCLIDPCLVAIGDHEGFTSGEFVRQAPHQGP